MHYFLSLSSLAFLISASSLSVTTLSLTRNLFIMIFGNVLSSRRHPSVSEDYEIHTLDSTGCTALTAVVGKNKNKKSLHPQKQTNKKHMVVAIPVASS